MQVRVTFRVNKVTGEVEVFEIDDENSTLPEAEHNREHERVATEIGRLVARDPRLIEVSPETRELETEQANEQDSVEEDAEARKDRRRETQ